MKRDLRNYKVCDYHITFLKYWFVNPAKIFLFKVWSMFKVNNKDTRTTSIASFLCRYFQHWTYFAPFSCACILKFEDAFVCLVGKNFIDTIILWLFDFLMKTFLIDIWRLQFYFRWMPSKYFWNVLKYSIMN